MKKIVIFEVFVIFSVCCIGCIEGVTHAQTQPSTLGIDNPCSRYAYYYKDRLIVLSASKTLIAVEETGVSFSAFVNSNRLKRDPLSDEALLRNRNLGLYRLPVAGKGAADPSAFNAWMETVAETTRHVIQPVFEQGDALMIPSDEAIVRLKEAISLGQAREYFESHRSGHGISVVREARNSTYILKIQNPSNGRVYKVCQSLSKLDRVSFAEPNHVILMRSHLNPIIKADNPWKGAPVVSPKEGMMPTEQALSSAIQPLIAPEWNILATIDCESPTFPPSDWILGWYLGATQATWGRTDYRSHNGSYSLYCSAAPFGNPPVLPPGPAPVNMGGLLRSPRIDLSPYEEVYVEGWFYAINDQARSGDGKTYIYDYPVVSICNESGWTCEDLYLVIPSGGDCTEDPTTDHGWRKFLFRVPPAYRVQNAYFEFGYVSNHENQFEGAYLDDIRIVGTTEVDTEPIGNDTYGARLYEMKNVGQIAELGNDTNDMQVPEAWELVSVSPEVVVAVIDQGVDLTHPDLNLDTGYDYDGSVGGGPRGSHGTACAGNAGAIGNNAIGVIGTAPGVRIMPIFFGDTVERFASAIDVAVEHGAHILSNSWGWVGACSSLIENSITDALAADRVVIFGAGNGPDRSPWTYDVMFPGNLTGSTDLICVGASSPTDEYKGAASSDGEFGWGSSYVGNGPDVCAPAAWSYTTDLQGQDGYNDGSKIDPGDPGSADYTPDFSGTSSSTPKVAGIVALMLSVNAGLTPAEVKNILRKTADDIGAPGIDDRTGAGRVNAHYAVLFVPTSCVNDPARIETEYYDTIQDAYKNAFTGETIECQAEEFTQFTGELSFDQNKSVSLKGGYDCHYTIDLSRTAIEGKITISDGSVKIKNIVIK
ncbi:MAG: S8 family serine peptidase [Deltaproteobacteria bacterium]|nr:S8 family serine peptidase [Deltaproteobacteria bacterium]